MPTADKLVNVNSATFAATVELEGDSIIVTIEDRALLTMNVKAAIFNNAVNALMTYNILHTLVGIRLCGYKYFRVSEYPFWFSVDCKKDDDFHSVCISSEVYTSTTESHNGRVLLDFLLDSLKSHNDIVELPEEYEVG